MVTVGPALRDVVPDCPICGLPAPPVRVALEPYTAGGRILVRLRTAPDDGWGARWAEQHPTCSAAIGADT